MTVFRFAILAGVSSEKQTEEGGKQSIPDQIKNCRTFIERTPGGLEAAGPFVMDGYSRTGYDSLEIAMVDIPPLADAIHAAEQNKYDVLLLDNFDRLGDLGSNVLIRFNRLKKQVYSIRQSGTLYDPDKYDPHSNEAATISIAFETVIQRYRIGKMQRGWQLGMPARIENGLLPGRAPFGYTYTSKNTPAVRNEDADLILEMKDMLFEGLPYVEISRRVSSKTLKLTDATIREMLQNPYYYGMVRLYKIKVLKRPDGSIQHIKRPRSEWLMRRGLHEPLWDKVTYQAIVKEIERRTKSRPSNRNNYPLRVLYWCGECNQLMYHAKYREGYVSPKGRPRRGRPRLVCRRGHGIVYDDAIHLLADKIRQDLKGRVITPRNRDDEIASIDRQIEIVLAKRPMVQEGYEAKIYTSKEAKERIAAIEDEVERLKQKQDRLKDTEERARQVSETLGRMDLDNLEQWIKNDDPLVVNRLLSSIIQRVVLYRGEPRRPGNNKLVGRYITVEYIDLD